jgi:aldehyde:ferredoxin oxidoreductase
MHIKGLEVTAYDCHTAPAMALAYGTSSIGAHHKDAFVIGWEIKVGRENYDAGKVDYLIQTQLLRGGLFEALGVCRFPFNQLAFGLDWYQKYLKAATGVEFSLESLNEVSDRILNLVRAFWVREYDDRWNRNLDVPPMRWFKEPLTEGMLKGSALNLEKYNAMLDSYYQKRGWNKNGVPKKETLEKLGLADMASPLEPKLTGEQVNMT